jgi:hypothetical protein
MITLLLVSSMLRFQKPFLEALRSALRTDPTIHGEGIREAAADEPAGARRGIPRHRTMSDAA